MIEDEDDETLADMDFAEFNRRFPKASREMMECIVPIMSYVIDRQTNSVAKWGAVFALDLPARGGRSMADIAAQYKWSKAIICHEARLICKRLGIPPSAAMKTNESAEKLKKSRENFVKTKRMKAKRRKD